MQVTLKSSAGVTRDFEIQHALRILQAQDQLKKVEWTIESPEFEYVNGDLSKKKPVKVKE
jgi:hypothetical protein